jgi:hypothetical protein
MGRLGQGDFIGHVSLMDKKLHGKHPATVVADTLVCSYLLSTTKIPAIIREQPAIALQLQIALGEAMSSIAEGNKKLSSDSKKLEFFTHIKSSYDELKRERREKLDETLKRNTSRINRTFSNNSSTIGRNISSNPKENKTIIDKAVSNIRHLYMTNDAIKEEKKINALKKWSTIRSAVQDAGKSASFMIDIQSPTTKKDNSENDGTEADDEKDKNDDHVHTNARKYALQHAIKQRFNLNLTMLDPEEVKKNIGNIWEMKHHVHYDSLRGYYSSPELDQNSDEHKYNHVIKVTKKNYTDNGNQKVTSSVDNVVKTGNAAVDEDIGDMLADDASVISFHELPHALERRNSWPSLDNERWQNDYGKSHAV